MGWSGLGSVVTRALLATGGLLVALVVSEGLLRLITQDSPSGQEYLLGRQWRYLVPLHVPSSLDDRSKGTYRQYDPDLGWTIGASGSEPPIYFSDLDGVRCELDQRWESVYPPGMRVDVITIGDSFTHGDEVLVEESWPAELARRSGASVLNLGVFAYGVDQATLRYLHWADRNPASTVILGLVAGDFPRSMNLVRGLMTHSPNWKSKPAFRFDGDQVRIINSPALRGGDLLRELRLGGSSRFLMQDPFMHPLMLQQHFLDRSYLFRVLKSVPVWRSSRFTQPGIEEYLSSGEWFEHNIGIIEYLNSQVMSRGGKLMVVFLGEQNSLSALSEKSELWSSLSVRLERSGVEYVDPTRAQWLRWKSDPHSVINAGGVHYTPEENSLVAEEIAARLLQ